MGSQQTKIFTISIVATRAGLHWPGPLACPRTVLHLVITIRPNFQLVEASGLEIIKAHPMYNDEW